jgi:hypothetical protein
MMSKFLVDSYAGYKRSADKNFNLSLRVKRSNLIAKLINKCEIAASQKRSSQ